MGLLSLLLLTLCHDAASAVKLTTDTITFGHAVKNGALPAFNETITFEHTCVTAPCTIVCQGLNYGDHRAEAGIDTDKPPYNLMFVKASSALSGPNDDVIRPTGVQLLDYELELGLVQIEKPISQTVSNEDVVAKL